MSTRRSGRSRSQSRSRRDEEEAGSEPAPAPSPARLAGSESESEFEESQEADERVLERAEELEKIKEQQRETREGLAALRQRFEDQGAAAAESQAEVKGLLQQLLAGSGTSAGSVARPSAAQRCAAVQRLPQRDVVRIRVRLLRVCACRHAGGGVRGSEPRHGNLQGSVGFDDE